MTIETIESLRQHLESDVETGSTAIVGTGLSLSLLRTVAISTVIDCADELRLATFMMLRAGPWFTRSAEVRALNRWEKSRSLSEVEIASGDPHGVFGPTQDARGTLYGFWFRASGQDAAKIETLEKRHQEAFFVISEAPSFDVARYASPAWFGSSNSQAVFLQLVRIAFEKGDLVGRCFGNFDDREAGVELAGDRQRLARLETSIGKKLAIR